MRSRLANVRRSTHEPALMFLTVDLDDPRSLREYSPSRQSQKHACRFLDINRFSLLIYINIVINNWTGDSSAHTLPRNTADADEAIAMQQRDSSHYADA